MLKRQKTALSFIIIWMFNSVILFSQSESDFSYEIESRVGISDGKNTPLWLNANKQGLSTLKKKNAFLKGGVFYSNDFTDNFSFGGGVELVGAYHYTSEFIIQQLYGTLDFHFIRLDIGSRERYNELKNHLLSSGGLTFSGNARPVPQVRVSIPEYVTIPGTGNSFHLKAHIAYGRFTDDSFQKDFALGKSKYSKAVLYHSKALFWKIGNDRFPLIYEGGLEMEAQFGGTTYLADGRIQKSPSRFIDYLKVFIPMSGDEQTTATDQVNVTGNHLGSWHGSLAYRAKDWTLRVYYEHFFEDHSQMFWEYGRWKDGLVGVEINSSFTSWINTLLYEYLYTKDQTGPFLHDVTQTVPDQVSGNDNYYNHVAYSSWSHWGMGMGNPLLISPIYNTNGNLSFRSNRVIAHHIGFMGAFTKEIDYRVLFSHTKHWGTYHNPLKNTERVMNGLLEVSYRPMNLKSWSFTGAFAADKGNLTGNNWGALFSIKYVR